MSMLSRMSGRVRALVAVVMLSAAGVTVLPATAGHAADEATVFLVQGLPGTAVTVAVDGRVVARDLASATVSDAIEVPAGRRTLSFTAGDRTLLTSAVTVAAGSSSDVVVHLPNREGAAPMVTVFTNDLSPVTRGKARLAVAHTAAVGPADIRVDGRVLLANVANGEGSALVVPAGDYEVAITPTGRTGPAVLGPATLPVRAGALNRVYAIGDPTTRTMNVATHTIAVTTTGSGRPQEVNTGGGGYAWRLGLT